MKTSEKAPRSLGSTSIAACSSDTSGRAASRAVSRSESVVATGSGPLPAMPRARASVGEFGGVDQVAVVPEREAGAGAGGAEAGLGVLPRGGAGRGVTGVPDRDVALQGVERGLVEDLRHQAEVLEHDERRAVADRDARGLLAAVLQGVQPEIGHLGDLFARRPHTEDAARVLRSFVVGMKVVGQLAVAPCHTRSVRGPSVVRPAECRVTRPSLRHEGKDVAEVGPDPAGGDGADPPAPAAR